MSSKNGELSNNLNYEGEGCSAENAWLTRSSECAYSADEYVEIREGGLISRKRNKSKYHISKRSGEPLRQLPRINSYFRSKSLSDLKYAKSTQNIREDNESQTESEDEESKDETIGASGFKSYTRRQKLTLVCLAIINFGSYLSMSIIAPFFPIEAELKGMTLSVTGYVFSLFALTQFLISPFIGKALPTIGVKFTFVSGIFLAAGCNILFGTLNYIDNTTIFTAFCFILRAFEAIGSACFFTAACTIVAETFPNDVGSAYGLMETFMGIGMTAGPAIGGALYSLGGYELPFYSLGACLMLTVPISLLILPNQSEKTQLESSSADSFTCDESNQSQTPATFWVLLKLPEIFITSLIVMILCGTWGFLDPILEPHFRSFGITPQTIGLLFLAMSGTYSITCPIVGKITDKWGHELLMMAIGLITTALCLFLMGPAVLFPFIPRTLWLNILALVLLGITIGIGLIPTLQWMMNSAFAAGIEENTVTHGLISSIFSSACAFGEFVGPAVGGVLFENYSFDFASTLVAFVALIIAAILIIHRGFKKRTAKEYIKDNTTPSKNSVSDSGFYNSETTPLMSRYRSISASM